METPTYFSLKHQDDTKHTPFITESPQPWTYESDQIADSTALPDATKAHSPSRNDVAMYSIEVPTSCDVYTKVMPVTMRVVLPTQWQAKTEHDGKFDRESKRRRAKELRRRHVEAADHRHKHRHRSPTIQRAMVIERPARGGSPRPMSNVNDSNVASLSKSSLTSPIASPRPRVPLSKLLKYESPQKCACGTHLLGRSPCPVMRRKQYNCATQIPDVGLSDMRPPHNSLELWCKNQLWQSRHSQQLPNR